VPGHQVVRHGLGCSLRYRVDDGVFYQRWQAVRHAQSIHGQDQVKGGDFSGWGEAEQGLGGSYGGSCAEGGSQQKNYRKPSDRISLPHSAIITVACVMKMIEVM
jgi:hypothetical protein